MKNLKDVVNFLKNFYSVSQNYPQQVAFDKQNLPSPFFNNSGNNFPQWIGKLAQDTQKRGIIQGMQDITNPIIQNPNIYPFMEPFISNVRVANFRSGGKVPFISNLFQ